MWYVPFAVQPTKQIVEVPPIADLTEEQSREGERRYVKQKQSRAQKENGEADGVSLALPYF